MRIMRSSLLIWFVFLLLALTTLVILVGHASAASYLSCEITDSCAYTEVLYLENETGGHWNAHAQLVTEGSYAYSVCCNSSVGNLSNSSCSDVAVLKLSDTTNAHVQAGNHSGAGEYSESACLSSVLQNGSIECIYTNSACGSDYECLASIASSEPGDDNMTNAHIADCGRYQKNVCCRHAECTSCTSCSKIIQDKAQSGGTVKLLNSITDQDGNCIEFDGTDNVTFDCQGFTISGDGDDTGYGINISHNANNNTITGCTNISYFGKGIWIKDSNYNRIENSTVVYNDENQGPSCPFVYSWTSSGYVFDNEGLTKHHFSMFNGSEYTRLPSLQPDGSEFKIKITEELPEDTYLNYVALYRVEHDSGVDVYGGWFNQLYTIEDPQEPISAIDDAGNDVSQLLERDGTYWNSDDFSGTNYTDNDGDGLADLANVNDLGKYLELTFEKPVDAEMAKLLLRPKQLPLKNYMGSRVRALLMEHDLFDLSLTSNFAKQQIKFGDDIFNGFVQENAFVENALIDIYVWNGTNWLLKSVIYEKPDNKGPDVVYPLNISDIDTEDLKIRFYTFPDLMGLDYVLVDYSDNDNVSLEEIPITSAVKDGGSVLTELSDIDDNLLLIESGEEVELTFTNTSSPAGTVTYFIELNGYYRGYDPENELNYTKQEVLSFFQIPFWNPRFFVPRYLDEGWGHSGIHLQNSNHSIITDVNVSYNDADGIYVGHSNNNTLARITAFNNINYGVYLYSTDNSVLTNITASNNNGGLEISGSLFAHSTNNTFTNIISTYNIAAGLHVSNSNNNTFTNITLSNNQNDGINIGTADNNTFTNITISNNQNEGIYIYDSENNTFRNATISILNQTGLLLSGSSQSHFVHDIDTSNTINGKSIQYFDGYHKTCPDNQTLDYNNTYSHVAFVGCYNVTLNNATLIDSLYLFYTNNSRMYNINSSYNMYGVYIRRSNSNIFINITANNNFQLDMGGDGITTSYSGNNTFTDITVSGNQRYGFTVGTVGTPENNTFTNIISTNNVNDGLSVCSDNSILINVTASGNQGDGIRITSDNSILINITASNNQDDGLYIIDSDNNTLTNITVSNNIQNGIKIYRSRYNIINNSRIENNSQYGIYLEAGSIYASYNTIYNNYLNNSVNLYSNNNNNGNYWNTTLDCSSGSSIIGGDCIGGNYWTDPDDLNFSDECIDANGNGICDSSYTPTANNTDYLPLSNKLDILINKFIYPDFVVSGEAETVGVNVTVKVNYTRSDIPIINITDEVPADFPLPESSSVKVYFIDYSPYQVIEITTNTSVDINVTTMGSNPRLVMVNISKMWLTDASSNMTENDSIMITYTMTTDEMDVDEEKTMWTHAYVESNTATFDRKESSTIRSAMVVVRGYKSIWVPVLSNPQNLTGKLVLRAIGGTVSSLAMSDYLPEGATVWDLNVTYYNTTNDKIIGLVNNTDYKIHGPFSDTLPDGTAVDVYVYNFSIYSFLNWDGQLYDNDTLEVIYNVSVLGGGQWILPTIIGAWDPQYQKHIKTEMYGSANVPSFDVSLKTLTAKVQPGEVLKGILRLINVGGPRAKVDVFVTYSAKTMQGDLIVERSETFAVVEEKEKELTLPLPENVKAGMYTFEAFVTYTGREALSTDIFEVVGSGPGTGVGTGVGGFGDNIIYFILVAVMGIVIGVLLVIRRK